MQSRLGLAHFAVFIICGILSISAASLGVVGVMTHDSGYNKTSDIVAVQSHTNIVHPKDKKWEPVFVLSHSQLLSNLEY